MPPATLELEALVARALASGDEGLIVRALGQLGRQQLADGQASAALQSLRTAAERATPLGEGVLGRALADLGAALGAAGEHALADRTFETALAHLRRAGDLDGSADVALLRARSVAVDSVERAEAAWADAALRCAAAGRELDELDARLAAARIVAESGDQARALHWLEDLAPRLDRIDSDDATWARGELGLALLEAGHATEALQLLARAAREEARAGRREAEIERLHAVQLCLAMLRQPT